ncbi:MAG: hypothetical protein STSR0009_28480 [Methanoregula sp.]
MLKVIVSNATSMTTYRLKSNRPFIPVPDAQAFDLNGNISINRGQPLIGNESVVLATDRAVIFSGTVGRGEP